MSPAQQLRLAIAGVERNLSELEAELFAGVSHSTFFGPIQRVTPAELRRRVDDARDAIAQLRRYDPSQG